MFGKLLNFSSMAHFRKDPFGPAWVIISPERGLEASDFGSVRHHDSTCPLCPGSEASSREIRALRPSASPTNSPDWRLRVIENPAALLYPKNFEQQGVELFKQAPSSGYQEIIIEHPQHQMLLDNMPLEHLVDLLKLYRDRLEHLSEQPDVKHVQITRNVGAVAGAVYEHPHAQVLALPVSNRWVNEELNAAQSYFDKHGSCLFCDVIQAEINGRERIISYNQSFIALAPYASKTPFETWILPRQHGGAFSLQASNTLPLLAELLQALLRAMNAALDYPPYNMIFHSLPVNDNKNYHWHIEILPRLTKQAGFDWGSGFYINPTAPEDAVRFLRATLALQEVGA